MVFRNALRCTILSIVLLGCDSSSLYGGIKTDADADTDADSDADSDADTDADTGATGTPATLCHPWEPVEITNFVRKYDVLYEGSYGLETQYGYGPGVTANGNVGFQLSSESGTGLGDWTYYYLCDHNGAPGFYLGEWEGEASSGPSLPGFPAPKEPISFIVSPPLPLLPAAAEVGNGTSWTYSVDANATSALLFGATNVPQTGTVTDEGLGHTIDTPAGLFTNALKITHEYQQDRSNLKIVGMGGTTKASGTHYYVEGLGLVYEKVEHLSGSDGTGILVEKQLKDYTGLTPVNP